MEMRCSVAVRVPLGRAVWAWFNLLGLLSAGPVASGAGVLPAAPKTYLSDQAGVIKPATAARLEKSLADYERETSVQIVVAIFPRLPDGEAMEDFTVRTAKAWGVGQKEKTRQNNGVVLFVFVQDKKMRIEVGYGLEGKIPDAIAKRITSDQIKPHFQRGDYDAGINAGANALMQAARGEYQGTGRTAASSKSSGSAFGLLCPLLFLAMLFFGIRRTLRGTMYHGRGRSGWGAWPIITTGGWGGGGGGGGWSGGGDSGGGFSGGGGDFGGGGASDSW